jgi:peptide chain release factor 3
VEKFTDEQRNAIADDVDGDPVFLATSSFMLRRTMEMNPKLVFRDIKDHRVEQAAA